MRKVWVRVEGAAGTPQLAAHVKSFQEETFL